MADTRTQKKKMYYKIDNGDTPVICDLQACMDMLEAEATNYNEYSNKEDKPKWDITLVWMTKRQYKNLPDAY